MRKLLATLGLLLLALIAYLVLAPVPVEPAAWQAPTAPGYQGPHAQNTRLSAANRFPVAGESGLEGMALGPDGKLYASTLSGAIVRMNADGSDVEKWARIDGRVLGLDFDARGRLIAADAMRGLYAIGKDAKPELLLERIEGAPIRYANSVAAARNGRIYFTDSTQRFAARDFGGAFNAGVLDAMEHSATGRVLEYDPATRTVRTVLRDLCFANGVALSADETRLYVAETCAYRVWSVDPAGQNLSAKQSSPRAKVLLDNLPGFPDNLTRGRNGRTWLGLVKPRGAAVDKLSSQPFLRKVVMRLPRALWPIPPAYGHVIAFDASGKIVADLQDPAGAYPETAGALETEARLYIQSVNAPGVAWLPQAELGLP